MTESMVMFWASLFAISYAYVGYPTILWVVSKVLGLREEGGTRSDLERPTVTLIVSAYNEEEVIGKKIKNALSVDYPRELLEIIVVDDASSDRTVEIALRFAEDGVVLKHFEGRIGKTACLNRVVPLAKGDIVVFSDANSTYDKDALNALVEPFRDEAVGFVTGCTHYSTGEGGTITESLGLYSKLELITKGLESRLGSCVGADGAIFAIRKKLYLPLNDYDINDFVIPLSITRQGYRGVLRRDAFCSERDAGSAVGEFRRQVRITNRTIRAIVNYRQLLNPFIFGYFSFQLFSHKVCRFVVPFFMVALLISNLVLTGRGGFFHATLVGQGVFYIGAAVASFVPRESLFSPFVAAARTFVVVNAAMVLGWVKYLQGEQYTTWSPRR